MGWRVGIDTGGTFTDLVAVRGKDLRIVKVPSTPPDFETGIVNSIISAGLKLDEIDEIAHGTTVATNAPAHSVTAPRNSRGPHWILTRRTVLEPAIAIRQ